MVSASGSEMAVAWELLIVELSKMDESAGETERGLGGYSTSFCPLVSAITGVGMFEHEFKALTFWGRVSLRGERGTIPSLLSRRLFAESGVFRLFSCSRGRFTARDSMGLALMANFDLARSALEGDRRGVASGDLAFASTSPNARRLLGDVVLIVPQSSPIKEMSNAGVLVCYLEACGLSLEGWSYGR